MSKDKILSDPVVLNLIDKFNLDVPLRENHTLNISKYSIESGFIVIDEIELLDINGKLVKLVDPETAYQSINQFIVTFNRKS